MRRATWFSRLAESRIPTGAGITISAAIIAIAVVVLYHELSDIDIRVTLTALRQTPPHFIALSGLCVACADFTLTFYDLFALRTLGRADLGYGIAALAGFTSYAIGHNVGATIFSAGAVRFRFSMVHGMSAIEVAKPRFIAGLTFWLCNAVLAGIATIRRVAAQRLSIKFRR